MPVYEYQCKQCGREFEYQQRMADPDKTVCENCGGALERLISRTAFQLKGSGWYKDLYSSSKPDKPAGDAATSDTKSADAKSGDAKSGDAKPSESKPAAESAKPSESKPAASPAKPASGGGTSGGGTSGGSTSGGGTSGGGSSGGTT
jgi:putative FmdB family regulatory protein